MSQRAFALKPPTEGPGERPRAVVLLLGFAGAQPKHVAKYATLYNSKGCFTVAGTAENFQLFIHGVRSAGTIPDFASEAVKQVAQMIRECENSSCSNNNNESSETPIVMHCLSNGGAFVSRAIGEKLDRRSEHEDNYEDLNLFADRLKKGCQIYDSAPCFISASTSFNVVKHISGGSLMALPAAALFASVTFVVQSVASVMGYRSSDMEWWDALVEDTNCQQQGFIYTTQDDVCDYLKVEEFIKERTKRGVNVMTKKFEESKHVEHLRLHPTDYSGFIDQILDEIVDTK